MLYFTLLFSLSRAREREVTHGRHFIPSPAGGRGVGERGIERNAIYLTATASFLFSTQYKKSL